MGVFRSAVEGLLGACRPAKIAWPVAIPVVNSVYAVLAGSRPDVRENPISECGVVVDPWLVHGDPATAVARVAAFVRVEAPPLDARPQFVERRLSFTRFAMGTVLTTIRPVFLEMEAPATLRTSVSKSIRPYGNFFPTVAQANTLSVLTFSFRRQPDNGKPSEPLSREVQRPRFVLIRTEAATTLDISISKAVCPDDCAASTITSTYALTISVASLCHRNSAEFYYHKSAKALSRKVERFGLPCETSAPLRVAATETGRSHNDFLSAVALASAIGLPVLRFGDHCEDGQASELLTRQIQSGWHIGQSIPWGHHACQ